MSILYLPFILLAMGLGIVVLLYIIGELPSSKRFYESIGNFDETDHFLESEATSDVIERGTHDILERRILELEQRVSFLETIVDSPLHHSFVSSISHVRPYLRDRVSGLQINQPQNNYFSTLEGICLWEDFNPHSMADTPNHKFEWIDEEDESKIHITSAI